MSTVAFLPARAKLCIGSLDDPELEVRAQYNPADLQIEKQIPWEDHKSRNNRTGDTRGDGSEQDDLEFNTAATRSMTVVLLFDGYESGESVEPDIQALEKMSSVQDSEVPARQQDKRRPHHCIVTWGDSRVGMRPFRCVIESLSVKYTKWDHGGMPLRATCTVKLKEAHKMGERAVQDDYREKRRGPGWDRKDPTANDPKKYNPEKYDPEEMKEYMKDVAEKLNSPKEWRSEPE